MSNEKMDNNPYQEHVINEFLKNVAIKSDMERNYDPSMSSAHASITKAIAENAIELIKLGHLYSDEGENISILVNDEIYDMSRDQIKELLTEKQYQMLFDMPKAEKLDKDAEDYKIHQETMRNDFKPNEAAFAGFPMYPPNPLMGMMGVYGYPGLYDPRYTQVPSATEKQDGDERNLSGILKDISNIQKKVILLEQERDDEKKRASSLNQQNESLKQRLENKEAEFNTEHSEKEDLLVKNNESAATLSQLHEQLANLEVKIELANDEISDKDAEISDLKMKAASLESDLNKVKNDSAKSHDEDISKIASLEQNKEDLTSRIDALNKEKAEVTGELASVRAEKDSIMESLGDYKSKLATAEANISGSKAEATSAKHELSQMQKKVGDLESEVSRTKGEIDKIKKANDAEIDRLNKQHKDELDKAVAAAKGDTSENAQKLTEMQKKVNALTAEKENLKKDNDIISKELDNLKQEKTANLSKIAELEKANRELAELAYNDNKTKAKNQNAFNKDFREKDKNSVILAMVSIRGMKDINSNWGRESGDKVINSVANALIKAFPDSSVYRILGDQFAVIIQNSTLNSISGQLSDVRRALELESINIVYGTAIGNNCNDYGEMINVADDDMERMKNAPVKSEEQQMFYDSIKQSASKIEKEKKVDTSVAPEEINMDEAILDFMNNE